MGGQLMAWLAPPPPFITSAGLAGTECSASLSMTAGTKRKRNVLAKVTHAHTYENSCKIGIDRQEGSTVACYVRFLRKILS
jgi:hypothetical protein